MWNGDTRSSSSSRARLPGFKHVRACATRKVNFRCIMSETEISLERFSLLFFFITISIQYSDEQSGAEMGLLDVTMNVHASLDSPIC